MWLVCGTKSLPKVGSHLRSLFVNRYSWSMQNRNYLWQIIQSSVSREQRRRSH